MNILIIHPDYDCDRSTRAGFLRAIAEQQAAAGHNTTVFTTQPFSSDAHNPSPPSCETIRGVHVRRVCLFGRPKSWGALRAANNVWSILWALLHAGTTNHYDLIIAGNYPAPLTGLVLRLARALRGVPFIYHCQELYPESAVVRCELARNRRFARLLRWDTATCIASNRTVVPSQEMAESLVARGVPQHQIAVINSLHLATDANTRTTLPPPLDERTDVVRFLVAGELGRHNGLERLVAAARLAAGRIPFQLVFMGDGAARGELIALAGDLLGRRIKFLPPQSIETTLEAMRASDYGIVSLAGDAHRYVHPIESILYGNAGCPVIALVDPQCELARQLGRNDFGYLVASRSVTEIADTLVKAVVERGRWTPERRRQLEMSSRALFGNPETQSAWERAIRGDSDSVVIPRRGRAPKAA